MHNGKKLRGLTPFMGTNTKSKAGFATKVFGKVTNKDPKGGRKLPDVQNKP